VSIWLGLALYLINSLAWLAVGFYVGRLSALRR